MASRIPASVRLSALAVALALALGANARAQGGPDSKALDEVLDVNVRDGLVYYRALESGRGRLDQYVTSLAAVRVDALPRDEQAAFWLNAYNATVLQTVIDHYPIVRRTGDYPARSIRQIPGAFERTPHRIGGKTLTLDEIEQTILPTFNDPRLFLALGRGAVGGGRLRSEAFTGPRLEEQLTAVAGECVTRQQCVAIDRAAGTVHISSIFSWRSDEFAAAYADKAAPVFADRSPIERAVLALVQPALLTIEKEFLEKNTFKVEYTPFDWSLNDLTGR
jgi:hypothetical protein